MTEVIDLEIGSKESGMRHAGSFPQLWEKLAKLKQDLPIYKRGSGREKFQGRWGLRWHRKIQLPGKEEREMIDGKRIEKIVTQVERNRDEELQFLSNS